MTLIAFSGLGDLETLQTRLEKGDDVNVQNEDGDGLLHVVRSLCD